MPPSGCCGDLWLKSVLLILACDDTKGGGVHFFSEFVKTRSFQSAYCGLWGSWQGKICGGGCWLSCLLPTHDTRLQHQHHSLSQLSQLPVTKNVSWSCVTLQSPGHLRPPQATSCHLLSHPGLLSRHTTVAWLQVRGSLSYLQFQLQKHNKLINKENLNNFNNVSSYL